jgi:hypothetical protein
MAFDAVGEERAKGEDLNPPRFALPDPKFTVKEESADWRSLLGFLLPSIYRVLCPPHYKRNKQVQPGSGHKIEELWDDAVGGRTE